MNVPSALIRLVWYYCLICGFLASNCVTGWATALYQPADNHMVFTSQEGP